MNNNFNIESFLDISDYVTDIRKNRRKINTKDIDPSGEFFTPYSIVKRMADKIHDSDWCKDTILKL